MTHYTQTIIGTLALSLLLSAPHVVQAETMTLATAGYAEDSLMGTPPLLSKPRMQNGVTFLSGGVSDEDKASMLARQSDYNLRVTNTNEQGGYVDKTQIIIRDKAGQPVINASAGPLFYAKLPAGSYTVAAVNEGQEISHKVTVGDRKQASLAMRFAN